MGHKMSGPINSDTPLKLKSEQNNRGMGMKGVKVPYIRSLLYRE